MKHDANAGAAAQPRDRFATDHMVPGIGSRVALALVTSYGAQIGRILITMTGMAALARLLSPADFGEFALASAFTGVAAIFVDLGFSTATTQRAHINQNVVSALFLLNVGAGLVMAVGLCLLTPWLSAAFAKPALRPLLLGLSLVLVFTAAGAQHRALLLREMRFPLLGVIDVISLGVGTAVAIGLALTTRLGPWCLIATQLIASLGNSVAFWTFARWRPSLKIAWSDTREELAFGARITASSLVTYFGRQADNLFLGYFCAAAELGQYTRAYGIMLLPMGLAGAPLTGVLTPALARVQEHPERWRGLFLSSLGLLVFMTVPISTFIFFLAPDIVRLILGAGWDVAAQLLRLFAVGMLVEPLITASAWSLFSLGRAREYLHAAIASTGLMVAAFAIGVTWGARGVAMGYSATMLLMLAPRVWHGMRNTAVSPALFAREIAPQLFGGGVAAVAISAVQAYLPHPGGLLARLVTGGMVIGVSYLTGFGAAAAVIPGEFRWPKLKQGLRNRRLPAGGDE